MFEEEEEEEEEGNGGGYRRRRDEPLYTEKIFSDRKVFFVDLKSNDRGRFLKITEDVRGRRDTIMVPEESLQELIDALQNVSDYLKNEDSED
ncbi:MAG: DNA-binding protein [Verrucomicrobiota bacterium]|nr:DNA-binding protein [Verrucomicrobiota bacterium]